MKSKYEEKRNREIDARIVEIEKEIKINQKTLIESIKRGVNEKEIDELISKRNFLYCTLDGLKKQKKFIRRTRKQLGEPIIDYSYSGQIVTTDKV